MVYYLHGLLWHIINSMDLNGVWNLPDTVDVLDGVTDLFPQLLLIEHNLQERNTARGETMRNTERGETMRNTEERPGGKQRDERPYETQRAERP